MSLRRSWHACLALTLLLPLLAAAHAIPTGAAPAFASPLFQQVWARSDQPVAQNAAVRSWLWGPQPGAVQSEPFAGAPGGVRTVQYFDKARMEINPAVSDPANPWSVTTGLLVVELVSGRMQTGPDSYETRAPAEVPVAGDGTVPPDQAGAVPVYRSFGAVASLPGAPDRRVAAAAGAPVLATIDRAGTVGALGSSDVHYAAYQQATGHNIPDVFVRFMSSQGLIYANGTLQQGALFDPVYVLGYPISEAYWATVPVDGKPTRVLIQLYQRRVLTYIPSFSPEWQVQMGNVGQHYYTWRYSPTPAPVAPAPPVANLPPAAPGDGFVNIAGNQFVYAGQPVRLKGTNYWLHTSPFVGTWADWDGPAVLQELEKAHELGVNTVRIGIPYDHPATSEIIWGEGCIQNGRTTPTPAKCNQVNGWIANQMTQLLQIASVYGMKVIFVLFDFSDAFPAPGSAEYQKQMNYLQGIVAPFANDDRVLAWDLHNEPENYPTWTDNNTPIKVINWAYNIGAAVRALDSHHPITIGVGNYDDLWVDAGGRKLIDLVDFVSFHCYDAGALRTQIDTIAARTAKPALLEEMGWPTGPADQSRPDAHYDEATQQFLYRSMLGDAKASNLVGVVQWTLWDYLPGTTIGQQKVSYEEWFGLVRLDGSFKPAAADFRDSYPVPLLPSLTQTNVQLTHASGHHP